MNAELTELIFVLDRSGSMNGLESDTIGGFNGMISRQKSQGEKVNVTTVLFDDEVEIIHDRFQIDIIKPLTDKEYYVRGCTALLDAVGQSIKKIENVQKNLPDEHKAGKVIFVITTDGLENSSVEYGYKDIKKMIEAKKECGWEFLFLGANIDAAKEAGKMGITRERAVTYENDCKGVAINYLLLKLKPCMMMSPLSVSYFLEAETYKFDMVIFDEASQIFPQDAIGAICRGKQVVIAGDSKQLPPTSFFAASTNNLDGEYDSEEDEEEVIYDSILEEATNSLPNRSLLWHYRSRNEDLIAFSNQEIYKNKLTTFPSSNTVAADSGVEYVYVEEGRYSGRCNIQEANKCVELIKEHFTKHPERSLGIIAFSEKQQATIEEAVHRFRERNPLYERFFAEDVEEPFFVKNLENVQGDERDTIIFSICYAKDPNGRMFMRFGPLGHQGGERRLNVAITRAKCNVKLVGSIMPSDIDLSKTKSEGIRMLKDYIEFAMKGSSVLRPYKNPNALYDTDEFCNCVCKFLEDRGYHVKQYVGNSEYKIDIAVEHPKYPGCYVAGIECDGNSYLMARTTRDREHLRKSILEQMGWKMFRVWSTEWINNKAAEQKRLLDFISDAIKTYKKGEEKVATALPKQEDSVQVEVLQKKAEEPQKLRFPYYRIGDWRSAEYDYGKSNLQNLSARIRAVVEVEQPIHLDVLYRRLASAFGNEKATKPVRDTIDQALNRVMANEIVIEEGFVRFKTFTEIRARIPLGTQDRNIEYISKPEIADAMLTVIRNSFGIDRDALCAEVTSIFGYDRMGPKITKAMNDTIAYMLEKNMVIIMDEKMHIKEA